jgi:CheY-like chemotaxis protein
MSKFDLTYIIDDDPIFVIVLKKLLSKMNVFKEVKNLKNGLEALKDLNTVNEDKKNFPDVIFLDLNMPVLDGWQFLEELQKTSYKDKLNIYVVSSTIDNREIIKCENYESVKNFISKPTNSEDLNKALGIKD